MRIADKVALPLRKLRKGFHCITPSIFCFSDQAAGRAAGRIGSAAGHISFTVSGSLNNMQQQQQQLQQPSNKHQKHSN